MTSQTKAQKQAVTAAIAAYAQVTGLSRFVIRASAALTAKAVEYRRRAAAAAKAAYEAK